MTSLSKYLKKNSSTVHIINFNSKSNQASLSSLFVFHIIFNAKIPLHPTTFFFFSSQARSVFNYIISSTSHQSRLLFSVLCFSLVRLNDYKTTLLYIAFHLFVCLFPCLYRLQDNTNGVLD